MRAVAVRKAERPGTRTDFPNLQIGLRIPAAPEPGPIQTLIVAEKDIAAKRIAQILSSNKSKRQILSSTFKNVTGAGITPSLYYAVLEDQIEG